MISKEIFKAIYLSGRYDKDIPEPKCVDNAWERFKSLTPPQSVPPNAGKNAPKCHGFEFMYKVELHLCPLSPYSASERTLFDAVQARYRVQLEGVVHALVSQYNNEIRGVAL